MVEKEKRKEKPKQDNSRIIRWGIAFILVFLVGESLLLYYFLRPIPTALVFPETTNRAIETQNSINLTLISASATAEATTHNTMRSRASETIEYEQTLYYVRETMTALGDWTWREATATAEAEQGR